MLRQGVMACDCLGLESALRWSSQWPWPGGQGLLGRRWGKLHSSPSLRAELLESSGQPWPLGNSQPVGWAQISRTSPLKGEFGFPAFLIVEVMRCILGNLENTLKNECWVLPCNISFCEYFPTVVLIKHNHKLHITFHLFFKLNLLSQVYWKPKWLQKCFLWS